MKKLFSIFTVVATVLTSVAPALNVHAASYSDELQGAYDYAYGKGITTQSSIDSANIYGNLTRGAMAKMMVNYAKEVLGKTADTSKACTFSDVSSAQGDLQGYITQACQMGIMGVNMTAFNPNGSVIRAEFGTALSRVLFGDKNNGGTPYYANHLSALKDAGVMTNISNPSAKEVRGYVMLMMKRADESNVASVKPAVCSTVENALSCSLGLDTCPAECKTVAPVATKAGSLSVSASSSAQSVPMVGVSKAGTFMFNAGNTDITLNGMTVTRQGLGNNSDVSKVYMTLNGARVSNLQSLGSDGTTMIYFSPALVVKANSSMNLDLNVYFSGSTSNGQHQFSILSANAIDASAQAVNGNFPVSTATLTTTNYSVAGVTFDKAVDTNTVKVGDLNAELGSFKLSNGDSNKTLNVGSITLRNDGTGDPSKNLQNIVIRRNGTVVSSAVSVTNRNITVTLNDSIAGGVAALYTINADIASVDNIAGDTYNFRLQNVYDVSVLENTTAFLANVVYGATALTGSLSTITANGADFSLTNDTASLANQTVTASQQDVELLSANLSVKAPIQIQDVNLGAFAIEGTGMGAVFQTLKLQINGSIVATISPSQTTATGQTVNFGGTFNVSTSGKIKVLGTLRSQVSAYNNTQFQLASLAFAKFTSLQYQSNGNNLASTNVIGSVAGNVVTVGGTSMTVTRNDGLSNTSIVSSSNVGTVFAIRIQAGSSSDLLLSQLNLVAGPSANHGALNGLASFTLKDGSATGTSIASANMVASGVNFNSLSSYRITKGTTKTLYVTANLPSGVAGTLQLALTNAGIIGTDSLSNSLTPAFAQINGAVLSLLTNGTITLAKNTDSAIMSQGANVLIGGTTNKVYAINISSQTDTASIKDIYVYNSGTMRLDNGVSASLTIAGQTIVGSTYASGIWFNLNGSNIATTSDGNPLVGVVSIAVPAPSTTGAYAANTVILSIGTGGVDTAALTNNGATSTISNGIRATSSNGQAATINGTAIASATQTYVPSAPLFSAGANANNFAINIYGASNTFPITLNTITVSCTQNGAVSFGNVQLKDSSNNVLGTIATLSGSTSTVMAIAGGYVMSSNATLTLGITSSNGGAYSPSGQKTCILSDASYNDGVSTKTGANYVNVIPSGGISASFN